METLIATSKPETQMIWYVAMIGLALGIGVVIAYLFHSLTRVERLLLFLGPVVFLVIGAVLFDAEAQALTHPWNSVRLAPSYAMFHGYPLYEDAEKGPIIGSGYTPLGYLIFAPLMELPTPSEAILAAVVFCQFLWVVPGSIVVVMLCRRGGVSRVWTGALVALYLLMLITSKATYYGFYLAHSDAPAHVFCLLSIAFLLMPAKPDLGFLMASAACAVAAAACKQPYVFVLVSGLLTALAAHGPRRAAYLAGAQLFFTALPAALVLSMIKFHQVWEATVAIPSAMGLIKPVNECISIAATATVTLLWVPVVILILALWNAWIPNSSNGSIPRSSDRALDYRLWIITAVVCLPLAARGFVRIGGADNHFCVVAEFLMIGAVVVLIQRLAAPPLADPGVANPAPASRPHVFIHGVVLLFIVGMTFGAVMKILPRLAYDGLILRHSPEDDAFEFARRFPGKVYFPLNPLTTLKSEGKAYHSRECFAVYMYREKEISTQRLLSGLPEHMEMIAVFRQQNDPITRFLPDFNVRVKMPEMPGWTIIVRQPQTTSSQPASPSAPSMQPVPAPPAVPNR